MVDAYRKQITLLGQHSLDFHGHCWMQRDLTKNQRKSLIWYVILTVARITNSHQVRSKNRQILSVLTDKLQGKEAGMESHILYIYCRKAKVL